MHLQILTPEKTVFDGEAESISVPGEAGGFEVLKDHAPILSSLVPGEVRITVDKKTQHFHTSHGFFEFSHNNGVLLADAVERPSEIDLARVQEAKARAQQRLGPEFKQGIDHERAQRALLRALSREKFRTKFPA